MTSVKSLSRIEIVVSGARGKPGINVIGDIVAGDYLVKAAGSNNDYVLVGGTGGGDATLRTDLATSGGAAMVGYKPTGAALSSNVFRELSRIVWVDTYGAKGDFNPATRAGTDDSAAFMLAAAALGGYGKILIPRGFRCLIASNLDMRPYPGVTIEAQGVQDVMNVGPNVALNKNAGDIYVDQAATIYFGNANKIKNTIVMSRTIEFGIASSQIATTFLGTAFILANGTWDHVFEDVMILGFLNGIQSQSSTGAEQCNRTKFIGRVGFDCINCVRIYNAYDIPILEGAEMWPYITYSSAGETNGAQLKRNGYFIWLHGVNDWAKADNAFCFGSLVAYRVTDARSVTLTNCGADYPPQSVADSSIGISIEGACAESRLKGCQVSGRASGIYINTTTTLMGAELETCNLWENMVNAVAIVQGDVQIRGGSFISGFTGAVGVQTATTAGRVTVNGVDFRGVAVAFNNGSTTVKMTWKDCTFVGVGQVAVNPYVPAIGSAATLNLDPDFDSFIITGTTNIGTISHPEIYAGRTITLKFTGAIQLLKSASINIAANYQTAAGTVVKLWSDGTAFYGAAASLNS